MCCNVITTCSDASYSTTATICSDASCNITVNSCNHTSLQRCELQFLQLCELIMLATLCYHRPSLRSSQVLYGAMTFDVALPISVRPQTFVHSGTPIELSSIRPPSIYGRSSTNFRPSTDFHPMLVGLLSVHRFLSNIPRIFV